MGNGQKCYGTKVSTAQINSRWSEKGNKWCPKILKIKGGTLLMKHQDN